jgi:carboxyl-terminal processing protease
LPNAAAQVVSGRLEGDVGYLKTVSLEPSKSAEIRAALQQLRSQGMQKLILDLRGCASGSMDEGVETARLFLSTGVITYTQGQRSPRQTFTATPDKAVWTGPLAILINPGTAGPAEVVAAVLNNKRGEVVGQRSYGGQVQKVIPLDDGSALILSVALHAVRQDAARAAVTPSGDGTAEQALAPQPNAMPATADAVVNKALEVLRNAEARPAA